jgi:hypothetical protein
MFDSVHDYVQLHLVKTRSDAGNNDKKKTNAQQWKLGNTCAILP